jgi:DNA polymerase II large subunit
MYEKALKKPDEQSANVRWLTKNHISEVKCGTSYVRCPLTLQSYECSECIALGCMEDLCYKDG